MAHPVSSLEGVVAALRAAVEGEVIGPSESDYDTAREVYYTGFSRRPAAIVRPRDSEDVARVVIAARELGLPLAVRGGGHSLSGFGVVEDGVVLDLSRLRGIEVDASGRSAWAQTGVTAGEYTGAVAPHGLATGFGDAPSVGIGGITLGGGVGFLHRKLGLTIDSVLGAEIVTADGRIARIDEGSLPDLFWAIRGGGGNFGVVTRFHFRLHEVDAVTGGMLVLPMTPGRIARFLELLQEAPDELSSVVSVTLAPPMPFLPAEHHGTPIILAMLVYAGPPAGGERVLAPFRTLCTPIVDGIKPMAYAALYEGEGEPPRPQRIAVHSFFTDDVDAAAGEAMLEQLHRCGASMKVCQFRVLGGAVARVPAAATAFAHRDRAMTAIAAAAYVEPAAGEEYQTWADGVAGSLRVGPPGAYVGFMGKEGEGRVREAYPGPTWERLQRIKAEYDPDNLFRLNQNIPPPTAR